MTPLHYRFWTGLYGSLPSVVGSRLVLRRPLYPTMSPNDPSRDAWESLGVC